EPPPPPAPPPDPPPDPPPPPPPVPPPPPGEKVGGQASTWGISCRRLRLSSALTSTKLNHTVANTMERYVIFVLGRCGSL
ncbi:unnamed protein product, partial [Cylicostephanus goldi]